ncbi:MAG: heavy metal translocating P-type ATPase [Bacteroidota bacterium]
MEKKGTDIKLNIEGMTCVNCAESVRRNIAKRGGDDVNVDFSLGEARFSIQDETDVNEIIEDINKLGYAASYSKPISEDGSQKETGERRISPIEKKFYFSLIFTIPLFSHMFLPFVGFLQHPMVQLALCLPVFILGTIHFGKSAFGSLKSGVPNMDVLILIGSTAAFIYSLTGTIMYYGTELAHNYLFYETTATIISLILLGNVLEHRSIQQTTTAISELSKIQATKAQKLISSNGEEKTVEVDHRDIVANDMLIVNNGDKIPVDGKITWGEAFIDESMITGESVPVDKKINDDVIGGTIIVNGSIKMMATNVGEDTVLSKIIEMVKKAQQNKPNIQRLGDKVSAIFVPIVVFIAFITFFISYLVFDVSLQKALMSSVAVLVISCPCAMGLATPTAVMAGIGRAARNGILIKGGSTLEEFAKIRNIVFDKTGTLTTGEFKIKNIECLDGADEKNIIDILFNLEQHSSHPIAKSIIKELENKSSPLTFTEVTEEKGLGIKAKDGEGNSYQVGSINITKNLTGDGPPPPTRTEVALAGEGPSPPAGGEGDPPHKAPAISACTEFYRSAEKNPERRGNLPHRASTASAEKKPVGEEKPTHGHSPSVREGVGGWAEEKSGQFIYVIKNDKLIARIDIADKIKPNAWEMVASLRSQNIKTIMLSGDTDKKCSELASQLQIDEVYSEQLPVQKLDIIDSLVNQAPTAMVGDGINDAPALAKATVGISLSNATQVAIQSAQIILLKGNDLSVVNHALQISKHTYLTIKQNLFWAFFYNVVAIPIAAAGLLNPMIGALAMAFSDVIVIGNSIRLKNKKIKII